MPGRINRGGGGLAALPDENRERDASRALTCACGVIICVVLIVLLRTLLLVLLMPAQTSTLLPTEECSASL